MLGMRNRRSRPLVDWRKADLCHQPSDPFTADRIAFAPEMARHLTRAIPRRLQELRVDQPHQGEIERRFSGGRR